MGELVRETPYSEITATMEVLDKLGVRRDHLARMRSESALADGVAALLIRGHGASIAEGDWFIFHTTSASLFELLGQNRGIFYVQDVRWKNEPFAKEKGQAGRKIAIRVSADPDSFVKTWDDQKKLLHEGEFVPTARDLAEGVVAYYRSTGKKLFTEYLVRTQSFFSNGERVGLYWDQVGLFPARCPNDAYSVESLSLAVARNASESVGSKELVVHVCTKCWPYQCINQSAHQSFRCEKRLSNLGIR